MFTTQRAGEFGCPTVASELSPARYSRRGVRAATRRGSTVEPFDGASSPSGVYAYGTEPLGKRQRTQLLAVCGPSGGPPGRSSPQ